MKKMLYVSFFMVANCLFPVHASTSFHSDMKKNVIIKMTINQQIFDVELANNPAAKEFAEQLPLTLNMQELNGNEKFAELPRSLSAREVRPGTINQGDLMIYGQRTLVLFYKTFQTAYAYTPVGRIIAKEELSKIARLQRVEVTFSADN
ncbi:cyclophilin-like fold protein [Cronobacter dublinensis]|uniref:cyclophilin-like fold protein n=1 Tax=Cronobacter dublinensis TaxID=413497 RepID=UPI000519C57D|nr:cyclophilin-like fold protein [Cronobacter dublinensis]ELY4440401.1 cyclophilin domain containing protein [Cronobacter dublinensis]MDI6442952.1 cyclophilin-like fold protein [Cronobacter dublinensis]